MQLPMSWEEWSKHDATSLATLIKNKEVTINEVAYQAKKAIDAINPKVSAVIEVFDDVIEDTTKDGLNKEGFFSGVPFLMKDLGPTLKGRLQEMGTLLMKGHIATEDSFLTKKIRQAGFNIIGRTTTPELGLCSSAENPALYVTRNPWNLDYTTCGSSAGTAAIVAAGAIPIAHATDGGGSTRIPAGVNGNIGLKPSRGVFSQAPGGSDLTSIVSTHGCHTRTIRDTAAFFDHCRGGAPGEFMPYWAPEVPYTTVIEKEPPQLKIAVSHEWGDYKAEPYIVKQLEKAADHFASLGHIVEWKIPEIDFHQAYEAQTEAYIMNFSQTIEELLEKKSLTEPPEDLVEPISRKVWAKGKEATYHDRAQMQHLFNKLSRQMGEFFTKWDIILTPTMALSTPLLGTTKYLTLSDNPCVYDWFNNLWSIFAYTPIANICGLPGISLPMGEMKNGMPLGIHALAKQGADGLLLQLGAQIERSLNGQWNHGRLPVVHVSNIGN